MDDFNLVKLPSRHQENRALNFDYIAITTLPFLCPFST